MWLLPVLTSLLLLVGFICLILCCGTVQTPMLYKRVLFCFFYWIFSLLNCQGPLGYPRNNLVLVIVYEIITDAVAHGGSFVYIQAVEHNRKKMNFFPGFALDFFINFNKVSLWVSPFFLPSERWCTVLLTQKYQIPNSWTRWYGYF